MDDIHKYQKIIVKLKNKNDPPIVQNNRRWIKIIDNYTKVELSRIRKNKLTGKEIDMDDIMFAIQCLCNTTFTAFIVIKNILPDILIIEPTCNYK
jgi:hypothetical protein